MRVISSWKDWRFPIGVHRARAMVAHLPCSTIHSDDSPKSRIFSSSYIERERQLSRATRSKTSSRQGLDRCPPKPVRRLSPKMTKSQDVVARFARVDVSELRALSENSHRGDH